MNGDAPMNGDAALNDEAPAGEDAAARRRRVAAAQPAFAEHLGSRLISAEPDRVVADLVIGEEHANRNGVMHGGAIMALADNTAGTATFVNLPEGVWTTTIDSKTNFFAALRIGDTARAESTPLHRGRTTHVWQTKISGSDGRLAALVVQTQMVMRPKG